MLIRPAGPADIEPALACMSAAFGLHLRAPTVHTLVATAVDGCLLVAVEEGVVVGTAASVGFGPTGWLGGVTVAPSARGRGLGRELTEAAIAALGPRSTLLLLASSLGRPIYERLGFIAEGDYRVFFARERGEGRFEQASRAFVRTVDRRVTGEDRALALDASSAFACGDAVALRPPWPALPIVGGDGAEELLRGLVEPGMRLSAPAENAAAMSVLAEIGEEREPVTRMRLGPPVDWRPGEIWGVFSLFFG